jgi:hypothetical protein
MKTNIEIEIKKIRNQLKIYGLSEEERTFLRVQLAELKAIEKVEKST